MYDLVEDGISKSLNKKLDHRQQKSNASSLARIKDLGIGS